MILLLIIALIVALIVLFFLVEEFYNLIFRGYAPLVDSQNKTLIKAVEEFEKLKLKPGSKVFELGCGQAGFLRKLEKKLPKEHQLTGIEVSTSIYWLAKLQLRLWRSQIKLVRSNFLKIPLNNVDCFYCYLNESLMAQLSAKLKKEAKKGSILISNQFQLPGYEPIKEVKLGLTNHLRIYKL